MNARADLCARAGVRRYPTWMIDGQKHEGVLTIEQLAKASKFRDPRESSR